MLAQCGANLMDGIRSLGGSFPRLGAPMVWQQRTGFEKTLLLTALGYGLYRNREVVGGVLSATWHIGASWARVKCALFGAKLAVSVDPDSGIRRDVMESRRPGSEEACMSFPACAARIGSVRDGGKFVALGVAVRFPLNMLVAPDHVLCDIDSEDKMAFGSQKPFSLRGKVRIPLATDLVGIILTEAEFSRIGVAECHVGHIQDTGAMVSIVGPDSKGTVAAMSNDKTQFGRVIYNGTTLAGYSGAPYMSGNRVVGLHQLGGPVNSGFSASFVWLLVKEFLKARDESSEDWLLGQYKAGREVQWREHSDIDRAGEYVQVCINGQYSAVKFDSMNKAFGGRWRNSPRFSAKNSATYGDFESRPIPSTSSVEPSGEANSSTHLGASSVLESAQGHEEQYPPSGGR